MRKIGQRYKDCGDGDIYILAQSGVDLVHLISLKNGNRWSEAKPVGSARNITPEEWDAITRGCNRLVRLKGYPK